MCKFCRASIAIKSLAPIIRKHRCDSPLLASSKRDIYTKHPVVTSGEESADASGLIRLSPGVWWNPRGDDDKLLISIPQRRCARRQPDRIQAHTRPYRHESQSCQVSPVGSRKLILARRQLLQIYVTRQWPSCLFGLVVVVLSTAFIVWSNALCCAASARLQTSATITDWVGSLACLKPSEFTR